MKFINRLTKSVNNKKFYKKAIKLKKACFYYNVVSLYVYIISLCLIQGIVFHKRLKEIIKKYKFIKLSEFSISMLYFPANKFSFYF